MHKPLNSTILFLVAPSLFLRNGFLALCKYMLDYVNDQTSLMY